MTHAPDWEDFGRAIMQYGWPTNDIDGSELFDLCLMYGLVRPIEGGFNPDEHIDAEGICPDVGDPWYEYAYPHKRADLPATDEQAFANEKVNALVEALRFYEELLTAFSSATDVNADIADETLDRDGGKVARAALEAMKETDDET